MLTDLLSPHMRWFKVAGALASLLATGYGLWSLYHAGQVAGRNEIRIEWDQDKLRRDQAQQDALLAYAGKLKTTQEQHDHDQTLIDDLRVRADGVRIHLPTCAGDATAGAAHPDGAAGALSERVDRRFAEFQGRVGRLITRCDQLNIDAIRANAMLH